MDSETVLAFLVPVLVPLIGSATVAFLGIASAYLLKLRARTKSEVLGRALDVLGGTALTSVASVMEASVRHLKAAADDGKLSPQEAGAAFTKAVDDTWSGLSKDVRDVLVKQAGSKEAAIKTHIEPSINRAVLEVKTKYAETLDKERSIVSTAQLNKARMHLNLRR